MKTIRTEPWRTEPDGSVFVAAAVVALINAASMAHTYKLKGDDGRECEVTVFIPLTLAGENLACIPSDAPEWAEGVVAQLYPEGRVDARTANEIYHTHS